MKVLLVSGLAVLLVATSAQARRAPHLPGKPHPVMASLEEAATSCFAETVLANPKAMSLAKGGKWFEAAGIIGFLCRPEVSRMVAAHDRLYGAGTGDRFFKGAYARHLDKQLATRLQPLLETQTIASAEPPADKVINLSDEKQLAAPVVTPNAH